MVIPGTDGCVSERRREGGIGYRWGEMARPGADGPSAFHEPDIRFSGEKPTSSANKVR